VPEVYLRDGEQTHLAYPRLDTIDDYLDWRRVIGAADPSWAADFEPATQIATRAWTLTLNHFQFAWVTHLVPAAAEGEALS
jgi:hypothetical protein